MSHEVTEYQQQFLDLFLPIRERLWRFVRVYTRADRDTVDDVMSETVMLAYESMSSVRDVSSFRSFCFTIARRTARKMKRSSESGRTDAPLVYRDTSDAVAPDVYPDLQHLWLMLDALPERMRETVVLFEISDLRLEEIRAIQGGTLSGVKSRLARGRMRLQEMLNDDITPISDRYKRDSQRNQSMKETVL